jgi:hypothetical protein
MTRELVRVLFAMVDPFNLLPAILIGIVASRLSTVLTAAIIGAFVEAAISAGLRAGLQERIYAANLYAIGIAFIVDCLLVFALASGHRERRRQPKATIDRSAAREDEREFDEKLRRLASAKPDHPAPARQHSKAE